MTLSKGSEKPRKSLKLLNVLFVLIVVPVLLLLLRSAYVVVAQRRAIDSISGRYVRQLARYGALRRDGPGDARTADFLALLRDRGYEMTLRRDEPRSSRENWEAREERSDKFIPGFLAYVRRDGTFLEGSVHSEILGELWLKLGRTEEPGTDVMTIDGKDMGYAACAWPTKDPDVVAVAAVTLISWVGGNAFVMGRVLRETTLVTLFCLIILILLRKMLLRPLHDLSSGLRSIRWGREIPQIGRSGGRVFRVEVEEVAILRNAIVELAQEAVEKKKLEDRYVGDVVKAQEEERDRLAREIHDGPIQVVAALMQRVQMASLSSGERPEVERQLALAEEAAQNVLEDLRGICDSLVPPWLSLGLARCLEETAERLMRQHDIEIDVDVDLFVELPQDKTLALFRIFQEGVSNAVRHGRARHMKLSVRRTAQSGRDEGEGIFFTLHDDGKGFEAEGVDALALYASGKRGLAGMRQRAESCGGSCAVTSAPGKGTTIEIRFG